MNHITVSELKKMTGTEGLVLQGCGGDLQEWADGINGMLTKEGILLEDDTFNPPSSSGGMAVPVARRHRSMWRKTTWAAASMPTCPTKNG